MTVFVDGIYSKECSLNTSVLAKLLNENRQKGEQARNVDIYRNVRMECTQKNEKDRLCITMSTGDLDRDNEKIDQSGWVLDGYKKNPVILWSHDRNIPAIGYMENIILGKTLQGEMIFNDREFDPFGWGIGQRLLKGSLNCGSVGFRVIEAEVVNHSVNPDEKADLIFRKQELLEFSVCNVPANPYAEVIRTARSGEEKSLYEFLKKGGYRLN